MAYGFGGAVADCGFSWLRGPRVYLIYHPYAREGADGQAVVCPLLRGSSPTRGVAPKQHRGLRRAFSPAFFGLVLFIPWRVGAEEAGAAKDAIMAYGFGGAVADFGFSWLRGPRVYLIYHPYACEGADGQAVVCPLLRGSSPTRGVAPKRHRGASGLVLFIPWRVGAE